MDLSQINSRIKEDRSFMVRKKLDEREYLQSWQTLHLMKNTDDGREVLPNFTDLVDYNSRIYDGIEISKIKRSFVIMK